jgi:hypothetical protein
MLRARKPGRRPMPPSERHESERGQLLVLFALAIVAMIAMVGLVIDGGDTALQRRDQQNVADAAAMAAGYAKANGQDETAAARTVAAANGYVHGTNNTTVNVTVGPIEVTVDVSRPHRNYFSGVVGFNSWDVATTATIRAGIPNGAYGAMPLIFNDDAFYANLDPNNPHTFGEPPPGGADVPQGTSEFNWTVFCTAGGSGCTADSATVEDLVNNEGTSTVVYVNDGINPLNAGSHTTLFDSMAGQVGGAFPVGIVDDLGNMVGWATFHITGAIGGSSKSISGYFSTDYSASAMTIVQGHGTGTPFGSWVVQLID